MYESLGTKACDWAAKSASEIRSIGEKDGSILILPVGSIEQHGNHLPVSTDTILVDAITRASAERIVDEIPMLVAPTMWQGYSPHHLPFGGTISLEFDSMLHVIEETATTGLENGFDAILLVNGHGGNISLINSAVKKIGQQHSEISAYGLTYFHLAPRFIDDVRESPEGGMGHGGEFETSLMLHLRPDLVDEEKFENTPKETVFESESTDLMTGGELQVYRTFDEYSDSGTIGDSTTATKKKGEQIFAQLQEELSTQLSELHQESR